ncbi:major facilitator superfamily domain-containing protein [Xylariales sp. PMI_506]|nr:major facilitator superfamily domain-containing protein [Xylariales sp. PMI_506]
MPDPLDNEDASSRDYTTVSETTPLVQSRSSSRTSRSSSLSSATPVPRDGEASEGGLGVQLTRKRGIAISISVYILIFLQASNASGMTMAQSIIAADLDAYEEAMWFTSAYLIALAAFGPLAGRLAAIFSSRTIILVTSGFVVLGGGVCAQATSFRSFIVGRVLTGIGGSGVYVLVTILVLEHASKKKRGLLIGLVNTGFTSGVSLGAAVYGVMIPRTGWRFLFATQVLLGAIASFGVYFSLPRGPGGSNKSAAVPLTTKLKNIDYFGAVLLTATLVLFLFGVAGTIRVIPIVISFFTLVSFVLTEFYLATDPIIPITILRSRGALLSCFSQLGFMAARWTVLFYAPITALAVFGFSPGTSGSMLIPTNLGFGMGALLVGWLHIKRAGSFYFASLVAIALFSMTLLTLSLTSKPGLPIWLYVTTIFANGLCTGAAVNYTLAHMLHLTPASTHYVSTSLLATFRGFAGSFGTTIGGGIFSRTLRAALERGFEAEDGTGDLSGPRRELVKRLVGSPALVHGGDLVPLEQQIAVQGYEEALRMLFRAAVALVAIVLVVQACTGWKGPADVQEDPEEIREAIAQHDREMEA